MRSLSDTFLHYHPNIKALGEVYYFTINKEFEKGIEHFISQMPAANEDQKILFKTGGVWSGKDAEEIIRRKYSLI